MGNTMAGIASLGGTGSYIGKVHKDQLGMIFHQDLESLGITFSTKPAIASAPTARCLVIVTPDGQRSMATYLGACVELGPEDIDAATIRGHRVTYLEGYLWDAPRAKEAMIKAAQLARDGGRQVALTLSDPTATLATWVGIGIRYGYHRADRGNRHREKYSLSRAHRGGRHNH